MLINKYFRFIFFLFLVIISSLLLSPFISLILPAKLTNRTYYRLLYHVIVDKETADCQNSQDKALKLLQYVVDHEFLQGIPYECKPAESLIYAEAWCDFQARTLNALLGIAGIPSRYAMLLDKDGISPHTLNEVFLNKKWCVFDTAINIIFRDDSGGMVSLDELSGNPSLIFNNKKIIALKEYDKATYDSLFTWYSRMFPLPAAPKRSTPVIYQSHLFDYIADIYFKILKHTFFDFYQDLYFSLNKEQAKQEDLKLFFMARNCHLSYRRGLALKYYHLLLKNFPQSKYIQDAVIFCGMLYFETGDFLKSVEYLKLTLDKYPTKYKSIASYYLGKAYAFMGDKVERLTAYRNASTFNLSAEILEELNKRGELR